MILDLDVMQDALTPEALDSQTLQTSSTVLTKYPHLSPSKCYFPPETAVPKSTSR